MAKMMFESESKRDEQKEDRKKVKAVEQIAGKAVKAHEKRMHKMAAGGMVARGGGAAKKGLKFSRNG